MFKPIIFLGSLAFAASAWAQTYSHPTAGLGNTAAGACQANTSMGTYTDDGGAAPYSRSLDNIYRTFCPSAPGQAIQMTFDSFAMSDTYFLCFGPNSCCDFLTIYDRPIAAGQPLFQDCTTSPGTVTATNRSGCLTVQFLTDDSVELAGWSASISTVPLADGPSASDATDCDSAIPVDGNYSQAPGFVRGPGLVSEACSSCLVTEEFSTWLTFAIESSGSLGFTISPKSETRDFDFSLYEASSCGSLGTPVRCSRANTTAATGLNGSAVDTSEDTTGDGFCSEINAVQGQRYYLLVNQRATASNGFNLVFSGTAGVGFPLPTATPSPTVTASPSVTASPTITPSPVAGVRALLVDRMYLGTGRAGSRNNGALRLVGFLDEPGGSAFLQSLLTGGFSLRVRDRDGSFNATVGAPNCRLRPPNQAVCNVEGPVRLRSVFRPSRDTPGRWSYSVRVFGLPETATGMPTKDNPLEAPVTVELQYGPHTVQTSIRGCYHIAHSGLVCS